MEFTEEELDEMIEDQASAYPSCKCIFTIPVCENREDHMRRLQEDG